MELETRRLLLRPLRDEDAPAIALGLNNYDVVKNLAVVPFPYSLEDANFFINLQRSFDPRAATCAIAFRCAPDELIGMVTYNYQADGDQFEFGYWLRECCWNMGLMSEAAAALVHYAMTQTEIVTIHSGYHTDNPISARILRKLGFVETHVVMKMSLAQGKEVPVMKMVLTRESWLEVHK